MKKKSVPRQSLDLSSNLAPNATNGHSELVSRFHRKNFAFTLIELLVVIAIVGILATVSVAQYNNYQERARQAKLLAFASQVEKKLMAKSVLETKPELLHLSFDNDSGSTFLDQSGSGNNYTSSIPSLAADSIDGSAQYLVFNGTPGMYKDFSVVPDNAFAISMLVKPLEDQARSLLLYMSDEGSGQTSLDFNYQKRIWFRVGDTENLFDYDSLRFDKWHHILAMYDGDTMSLYVDGNFIDSKIIGDMGDLFTADTNFQMGYGSFEVDRYRLFSVGLDPSEL